MEDSLPEDVLAQIQAALFVGRKIEAIKLYREVSGKGLAEAKEVVEGIETELRASAPDQFQVPQQTTGCAAVVILLLFGIPGFVLLLWGLWALGNAAALSAFGVRDEGKLTRKQTGWASSEIFGYVVFDPVRKTVEITGQSRFGGPPQHPRVGTHIPVVYWQGKPETARWNTFGVLYFPNLILAGVGLLFTVFSRVFWSCRVRRVKPNASGAMGRSILPEPRTARPLGMDAGGPRPG